MWFFRDIVFPIVIALLALASIVFILNLVLRFFHIDIPIIRFIGLVGIWYYVGPVIYNWLSINIILVQKDFIKIIYTPVQSILAAFEKIV